MDWELETNSFGREILMTFQVRTCTTMISSRVSCPSMLYCTLIICEVCEFSDGISVVYEIRLWITSLIYTKLCRLRRLDLLLKTFWWRKALKLPTWKNGVNPWKKKQHKLLFEINNMLMSICYQDIFSSFVIFGLWILLLVIHYLVFLQNVLLGGCHYNISRTSRINFKIVSFVTLSLKSNMNVYLYSTEALYLNVL